MPTTHIDRRAVLHDAQDARFFASGAWRFDYTAREFVSRNGCGSMLRNFAKRIYGAGVVGHFAHHVNGDRADFRRVNIIVNKKRKHKETI